jgi:hypothetical protein
MLVMEQELQWYVVYLNLKAHNKERFFKETKNYIPWPMKFFNVHQGLVIKMQHKS